MTDHLLQWVSAALFALALIHKFTAKQFERLSHRYPRHAGLFHLLGEVEVVFGFWAMVLVLAMAAIAGGPEALAYAESRKYTEPLFVFVVMVVAASLPVGANVFLFSQRYRKAEDLVTASVAVSTALALLSVSLVMALLPKLPA